MHLTALSMLVRNHVLNLIQNLNLQVSKKRKLLRIMKLTTLILLTACLTAGARSYSQRVSISVKNASLETVFREIKKQTGYQFLYNNQMLDGAKKVSIQLKDASLDEALRTCFKDQPFTYEIVDKTIVIARREERPTKQSHS